MSKRGIRLRSWALLTGLFTFACLYGFQGFAGAQLPELDQISIDASRLKQCLTPVDALVCIPPAESVVSTDSDVTSTVVDSPVTTSTSTVVDFPVTTSTSTVVDSPTTTVVVEERGGPTTTTVLDVTTTTQEPYDRLSDGTCATYRPEGQVIIPCPPEVTPPPRDLVGELLGTVQGCYKDLFQQGLAYQSGQPIESFSAGVAESCIDTGFKVLFNEVCDGKIPVPGTGYVEISGFKKLLGNLFLGGWRDKCLDKVSTGVWDAINSLGQGTGFQGWSTCDAMNGTMVTVENPVPQGFSTWSDYNRWADGQERIARYDKTWFSRASQFTTKCVKR